MDPPTGASQGNSGNPVNEVGLQIGARQVMSLTLLAGVVALSLGGLSFAGLFTAFGVAIMQFQDVRMAGLFLAPWFAAPFAMGYVLAWSPPQRRPVIYWVLLMAISLSAGAFVFAFADLIGSAPELGRPVAANEDGKRLLVAMQMVLGLSCQAAFILWFQDVLLKIRLRRPHLGNQP